MAKELISRYERLKCMNCSREIFPGNMFYSDLENPEVIDNWKEAVVFDTNDCVREYGREHDIDVDVELCVLVYMPK